MVDEHPMVLASRHPSDLELFKKYLIPWIMGDSAKPEFIHQFDVYTEDPTELTKKFLPTLVDDGEQAWYFFSPVRAKGRRGPRKARTAGEGCWHSEAGCKPVKDDLGNTIGRRQFFSFVYKTDDGRSRIRTGWLMVELGLHHEKGANRPLEEMVLCKIYFTPRTPSGQGVTIPAVVANGGKRKTVDDESSDEARPVKQCRHGLPEATTANNAVTRGVIKEAPPVIQCSHGLPEAMASNNVVTHGVVKEAPPVMQCCHGLPEATASNNVVTHGVVKEAPPVMQCCHGLPEATASNNVVTHGVVKEAPPVMQCCHGLPETTASNNVVTHGVVKEAPPVMQCCHGLPEATASNNVVTCGVVKEAAPVLRCYHGLPEATASNNAVTRGVVKEAPPVIQCGHSLPKEPAASTNVVTIIDLEEQETSGAPDSPSPPTSSESPPSSASSMSPPSPTSSTSPPTLSPLLMPRASLEMLPSSSVPAEDEPLTVPADSSRRSSTLAAEQPYFTLPSADYSRQEVERVIKEGPWEEGGDANMMWTSMATCLRKVAVEEFGVTKGSRREAKDTWWWNDEVQKVIREKKDCFRCLYLDRSAANMEKYKVAKKAAKRAVREARGRAYEDLYQRLNTKEGERDIYKMAKFRERKTRDVNEVKCIKDGDDQLLVKDEAIKRRWREYFDNLYNGEAESSTIELDDSFDDTSMCFVRRIQESEVKEALRRMKGGKAMGPDGIPIEAWRGLGDVAIVCDVGRYPMEGMVRIGHHGGEASPATQRRPELQRRS
ncbi:hypothetical protein QYE76_054552 [Lolium multiflorum]|uniref:NAC domain-containing protein n=1 Tax=Lolium multiflorum TaxID=4521 RepID=A0AAD8SZK9_LOLMU|nr:hypothetical protein QYE76_054552 [Lolium multiflorum]